MIWEKFKGVNVSQIEESPIKRRYSVTSDILSYQRCPRQYGFFAIKGYAPAYVAQMYFGTIIHEVLDRAHSHYKGLIDPQTKGQIPTDDDIETYFSQVEDALRARGIKALGHENEKAIEVLKIFNRLEGPSLYPRVKETEYALQADKETYILRGNVDVLIENRDKEFSPKDAEIWDYKGQKFPTDRRIIKQYKFQMNVYAELYRMRTGVFPKKAILYFINELDKNTKKRPDKAYHEVEIKPETVQEAMKFFEDTVRQIDGCRNTNVWNAPQRGDIPPTETCDICDIRWSCKSRNYPRRYP